MSVEQVISSIEDEWTGSSDAEGTHLLQYVCDHITDADDGDRWDSALSAAVSLKDYADTLAIVIRRLKP